MSSIQKYIRPAVLGLAVLTLALAPAAAHAAQPAGAGPGMLVAAWSRLVDFGERLASAVGLSSASEEEPAPAGPTLDLLPDDGQDAQCGANCPEDDDSGPTMDPDG